MCLKERVVENKLIGHPSQGIYKLILSGQAAKNARPGQFVHIKVSESNDPLLRRPLSIAGIAPDRDEITIYYRVAGRGTDLLTRIRRDDRVSILGPLGSSFTIPQEGRLLLIGGGIGVFPLFSILEAVNLAQVQVKVLWGGENKAFLESAHLEYLHHTGVDYELATMDGSLGTKGLVTELLRKYLQENKLSADQVRAAACGPKGMLKAVAEICLAEEMPLEVSLEERMACGIGACLGCVCTVRDQEGQLHRKRVCKEGPVFDGKEVVWDAEV